MSKIRLTKGEKRFSILQIYTLSCLFFFVVSVFNIYNFKVYDTWSLVVFYIYAAILWVGIKAGGRRSGVRIVLRNSTRNSSDEYSFLVNKQGQIIIYLIYIGAILSFLYFLVLYRGSFNITSFGTSLKAEYDEVARSKVEVITLFIMYAGSAVYLIVIGSKDTVSKLTLILARICLFLPGLRGAFLGRRFTLAVEVLIYFFAEYESISNRFHNMDPKSKKTIRRIITVSGIAVIVLLYIFSQRIVYFPDTLFVAIPGDTELKPFWREVYNRIGNRMSIFAYVSYYAGHAPYAFSYSYVNMFPVFPRYWGLQTCRVFIQIITSLFGISPSYAEMSRQVPGIARYTSYAGTVISDFGMYFAPFVAFLFGYIFGKIERERKTSPICHSLYPIVQAWCVFAPVYFFTVGVLDQVAFWAVILTPLCVSRCCVGIDDYYSSE